MKWTHHIGLIILVLVSSARGDQKRQDPKRVWVHCRFLQNQTEQEFNIDADLVDEDPVKTNKIIIKEFLKKQLYQYRISIVPSKEIVYLAIEPRDLNSDPDFNITKTYGRPEVGRTITLNSYFAKTNIQCRGGFY